VDSLAGRGGIKYAKTTPPHPAGTPQEGNFSTNTGDYKVAPMNKMRYIVDIEKKYAILKRRNKIKKLI